MGIVIDLAPDGYVGECYHIDTCVENSSVFPIVHIKVKVKGISDDVNDGFGLFTRKSQDISFSGTYRIVKDTNGKPALI